jgi:hypothetical protein
MQKIKFWSHNLMLQNANPPRPLGLRACRTLANPQILRLY